MTQFEMNRHIQTWVKVNAQVDEGVADLVSVLSEVDGLETIASCQGDPIRNRSGQDVPGYVFFRFGDWHTISEFAFGTIAPVLNGIEGTTITVEIFGGSDPTAKLGVLTASIPKLVTALRQVVHHMNLAGVDMATVEFPDERTCRVAEREIAAQFKIRQGCFDITDWRM